MFQPNPKRLALLFALLLLGQPLMAPKPAWSDDSVKPKASQVKPKATTAFPWTATDTQILRKAKRTGNPVLITSAYSDIGDQYLKAAKLPQARAIYTQALEYAQKKLPSNQIVTGLLLSKIGSTYLIEGDMKQAFSSLSKSVGILQQIPSMVPLAEKINETIAFMTHNLEGIKALQAYDGATAESKFQQALAYIKKHPDPAMTSQTNYWLGMALLMQDNYTDAEKALAQAWQHAERSPLPAGLKLSAQLGYAQLYTRQGQLDKAKTYYQQTLAQPEKDFNDIKISKERMAQELTHLEQVQTTLQKISTPIDATNYYPDVLWKQQVFHWNLSNGVIRVYIAPASDIAEFTPEYIQRVKAACKKWQLALADRVRFYFTDNADDPVDVTVHWQNQYNPQHGQTHCHQQNGKLNSAEITLNLQDYNEELQAPEIVYRLALHEVGHVLGLMGHSRNPQDVMYPGLAMAKGLSSRDAATIRKLYQTQAQITNPSRMTLSEYRQTPEFQSIQSVNEAMEVHP